MLSLKPFGVGDTVVVTFSGDWSGSPLTCDCGGSFLVCLLEKVTKVPFISVKLATEAVYDGG